MKKVRRIILWILLLALVAALAILPAVARQRAEERSGAALVSAAAERGEITRTLAGGGTLAAESAVEVTVPSGVELTEYLVGEGDYVTEGTPIAAVDRVSVMAAVVELQETLDTLADEIREEANDRGAAAITAPSAGRVKALYAAKGDDVRGVMLQYGCLAVLSLDGKMAVEFATGAALTAGQSVQVAIEGGKSYEGRVESCLEGVAVVTLTDNGPNLGDEVTVTAADEPVGTGTLYVHNGLDIIAQSGTVSRVYVRDGAKVSQGANLFYLENMDPSAAYESLSARRREYSELLQELFTLYRDGTVNAPENGYVIELDDALVKDLRADGGYHLRLLDDESAAEPAVYTWPGVITAVDAGSYTVQVRPDAEVYATLDPTVFALDDATMSFTDTWPIGSEVSSGEALPVYPVGSEFMFVYTADGAKLTMIYVAPPAELTPTIPDGTVVPTIPPTDAGSIPGYGDASGSGGIPGFSGIPDFGGISGFGGFSGGYSGGLGTTEEEAELFDLDGTVICSLVPDNSMKVSFSVDELDVLQYAVGMEAEITVDALPGRTFTGTVTKIGTVGASSGGNSKFTVTVSFDRIGDMLEGMNASVVVHAQTVSGLLIPAAALTDSGSRTYVYTALDRTGSEPAGPTEVVVGVSDGEMAVILSGLAEGQTVYYIYYGRTEPSPAA